jgi:hypothetical protein
MLPSELVNQVRARLFDSHGERSKSYWSDYELLVDYGNIALDKMFLGVRKLITDSSTLEDNEGKSLCQIVLLPSRADYPISPKIIEITSATLTEIIDTVGTTLITPMSIKTVSEMDAQYFGWRSYGAGSPRILVIGLNTDSVHAWPTPLANEDPPPSMLTTTVNLTVQRFMLQRLAVGSGENPKADDNVKLTFREEYHANLIPGILAEAYMKDDGEIKRVDLAMANEKKFEEKIESMKDDLSRRLRTNHGVRTKLAYK